MLKRIRRWFQGPPGFTGAQGMMGERGIPGLDLYMESKHANFTKLQQDYWLMFLNVSIDLVSREWSQCFADLAELYTGYDHGKWTDEAMVLKLRGKFPNDHLVHTSDYPQIIKTYREYKDNGIPQEVLVNRMWTKR